MAGSFDIFRRNQKIALAGLAIMAMIAFFVLPPFLQMDGAGVGSDAVVVSWKGGELRESGLQRAVQMRAVLNRFLLESAMVAGRDPSRVRLPPDSEQAVVMTEVLAREAAANGIVVTDAAINDFLAQWTANLVRKPQFDQIIGGLPMRVGQHDLFEALRSWLAARHMESLFRSGFGGGDPPGWRWDYFRRLEQAATVEVVPVVAESLAAEVAAPSEATLRAFFEAHKNDLPDARSAEPGFREPHRVKYEYLVAKRESFDTAAAATVTEEQIVEHYEKNKMSLYRAAAGKPDAEGAKEVEAPEKPTAGGSEPPRTESEKPSAPDGAAPQAPPVPKPDKGAAVRRSPFVSAAFRQPAAGETATSGTSPQAAPAGHPATQADAKPAAQPTEGEGGEPADDAPQFQPLAEVREEIRNRLARQEANKRIDAVFSAIANDVSRYAESYVLWQARGEGAGAAAPTPPDIDKIAAAQGLEAGRSQLVTADQAVAAGPLGGSFELMPDPSSRFGIRQQQWLDMMFAPGSLTRRPVTTRDVEGNRYISWKTEDQPEFTPTFQNARQEVERVWRLVEARGLARGKAEEIARQAEASRQTLAAVVAGKAGLEARQVGPFTWLTQGTVSLQSPPALSEPEGIEMPGEEFMQAVFALEPGAATVAFNEPRTVCYAVRLESLEPPLEKLRERFLEDADDQQRLAMVAQREATRATATWVEALENRQALTWHREPR